jgi:hypothetical protein
MPALTKAQKKQAQAAVDSFNRTYATLYGEERWYQSLYPALAGPTRYAALVNCYATATATATRGGNLDNVLAPEQNARVQRIEFPAIPGSDSPACSSSSVSGRLEAYQWEDISSPSSPSSTEPEIFPPPQPSGGSGDSGGLMTHWNLDAASLLAVHVLGPKPGDKVLDLCAAPGGKSVAISQLLRPENYNDSASPSLAGGCLHSNEVNPGRNKRLASNLQVYLPKSLFTFNKGKNEDQTAVGEQVKVLKIDGAEQSLLTLQKSLPLAFGGGGGYDTVLLDAPCSSERHIIHAYLKNNHCDEMTSWRSTHSKKLAKTQVSLLMNALRAVKVGGRVLYATCSLSNEENDGVVEKARELVMKERKKLGAKWGFVSVGDKGSDKAGEGGGGLEDWAEPTRYGWLVLPDHPSGGKWGPLYFALLEKVEV